MNNMVQAAPIGSHIFIRVDRDADMQRFLDEIRARRLPENFHQLCNLTSFMLEDQRWSLHGTWHRLCRRCGRSFQENAGQLWEMHNCAPAFKISLIINDGNGNFLATAEEALEDLKERAGRLRTRAAWLLWELVCEHVIELYLQHYTHVPGLSLRTILERRLISPRVLRAAPRREESLWSTVEELEPVGEDEE